MDGFLSKSTPSAPAAPDPTQIANAQTASNEQTAQYNFGLSNPNYNTPLGNINYSVDNSNPNAPQANATVNLSPAEQQIFNTNTANTEQQGQIAGTALQGVQNTINTPYNLSGNVMQTPTQQDMQGNLQNVENANYQQQTQYLDPQFNQEQSQMQSQLANQGIAPGSNAYNTAQQNFGLQKQQAYGNAQENAVQAGANQQSTLSNTALANQAQQAQLYTQQYQEPVNLYSSLESGTSPTMPQFSAFNPSTAAPTNTEAAQQMSYNGQLNAYNAQTGSANSTTSGLFNLGGSLGSAAMLAMLA